MQVLGTQPKLLRWFSKASSPLKCQFAYHVQSEGMPVQHVHLHCDATLGLCLQAVLQTAPCPMVQPSPTELPVAAGPILKGMHCNVQGHFSMITTQYYKYFCLNPSQGACDDLALALSY